MQGRRIWYVAAVVRTGRGHSAQTDARRYTSNGSVSKVTNVLERAHIRNFMLSSCFMLSSFFMSLFLALVNRQTLPVAHRLVNSLASQR